MEIKKNQKEGKRLDLKIDYLLKIFRKAAVT
jgi:hypothetical protein